MSKKQQSFRRVLTFILAVVLALGFLSTVAFTVGADDGNIDFDDLIAAGRPHGECGAKVKWVLDGDLLIISGTGAMYDFDEKEIPWGEVYGQIKHIVIQPGVTSIGNGAFAVFHALESVILPDTLTTIGSDAFAWSSLPRIEIPASVTNIDDSAFYACQELTAIVVDEKNPAFASDENGVLFNKDKTKLLAAPCMLSGKYAVPAGVKTIGDNAFVWGLVTDVTIPSSVTTIGKRAFSSCGFLESVTMAKGVKTIGAGAFENCTALKNVEMAYTVTTIADGAFFACEKLPAITIPASVTAIGAGAFEYCLALTDVLYVGTQAKWDAIQIGERNECLTNAKLSFADTAKIVTQPKSVTVAPGQRAVVTVKAAGDGVTYTWYYMKKGATAYKKYAGTTNVFTSGKMSASLHGCKVYCVVTDKYGTSVKTNVVTLGMGNPATITTQPKHGVAPSGSRATVSIKATGDGVTYTWYYMKKGATAYTKYAGTTNVFTSGKMSSALHGCKVYCVVTDKYGTSVKSNVVTLYMGNPAKIATQPTNAAAPKGKTAKVTVKATGDGLTYTWYHKNAKAASYSKSSVTSATYSAKMSSTTHGRYVYCVVKDKYGNTVKTAVARLYMGNPAKITTQPKSIVVVVGKTAKITLKATGDGLKYTWYHKSATGKTFNKASVTGNTYSLKMADKVHGRQVYCVVTDKYGISVKSAVVTITKANTAQIVTQPTNAAAPKGSTAKVGVKATGDGLTYTWYYAKKGSSKFTKTSVKTATYSLKMSSSNNGRKVYCVVKDKYGTSVKTKTVTLYMGNPAKIVTQPKSVKVAPGQTAKVGVKATGDGLTYTWYHKSASAASYSKSSVTSATYSVKMSASVNGRYVYCVVKDKYGITVKTGAARLYMGNPATIVTQPKSVKVAPGQTAKVGVKATGDGLTYTWYHKSASAAKYSKSSVTTATYSVKMSASVHGRYAYCVITDKYGTSVKTNAVRLYMGNPVKITAHPQNVTVAEGAAATATVKATGDGLKYIWYQKDASASAFTKSSVTTATYSVTMSEAVDGRQVYCIVSDQYGNAAKSNLAILTMEAKKPQIDWTMGSWTYTGLYCEGEYNEFDIWFAGDGTFGTVNVAYWQVLSQEEINEYLEMGWSMDDFREIEGEYCANFHGTFRDFHVVNQKGNTLTLVVDYGEDGENIGTLTLELQEDKSLKILSVDNFVSDDALQAGKFFTWVEPEPSQMAMITSAPKGVFGDYGETVRLTVEAEGENLTYQWYEIVITDGQSEEVLLPDVTGNTYSVVLTKENAGQLIYCKVLDDAYHFDHTGWMVVDYIVPSCQFDGFTAKVLNEQKDKLFKFFMSVDASSLHLNVWSPLGEGEEPAAGSVPEEIDGVLYYPPAGGDAISYVGSVKDGLVKLSIIDGEQEVAAIYLERTAYETLVVDHTTGTVDWLPGCLETLKPGTIFNLTL